MINPDGGSEQSENNSESPAQATSAISASPPLEPSAFRRWIIPALKVGLAAGLLYYILATRINDETKLELRRVFFESPASLAAAIGAFTAQLFLVAQRMRILLAAQDVFLNYWTSLRLTYIGAFFDPFMVTSVGGDAVKAVYLARVTPVGRRLEAISVLLLDRLMGLIGLMTLMLLMTTLYIGPLKADPDVRPYLKWLFGVPTLLLIGTWMLLSQRMYRIFKPLLARLPLGSSLDRAFVALQRYRGHRETLAGAWLISVVVHACSVISGYVLVLSMNANPDFESFLVAWFISNFIVSFAPASGIGFGQWLYDKIFYKIANVQNGWVLATAVQATSILAKLPGFMAWVFSRESAPPLQLEERKT